MFRSSLRTVVAIAVGGLVLRSALTLTGCDGCSTATTADTQNFYIGLAMLGGLVWGATWLEKAPLKSVALNLAGLGAASAFVWMAAGRLAT